MEGIIKKIINTGILLFFIGLFFTNQNVYADINVDYELNESTNFTRDFDGKERITCKVKVKNTGVYYFELPEHFGIQFYNDSDKRMAHINAKGYSLYMLADHVYYLDIFNDKNYISRDVNIHLNFLGDQFGKFETSIEVAQWTHVEDDSPGYSSKGKDLTEEEFNKLGIIWENHNLTLNNFNTKNITIEFHSRLSKFSGLLFYIPYEVLPNNAVITITVNGDNYFASESTYSNIGDTFWDDIFTFKFVGNGSITFSSNEKKVFEDAIRAKSVSIEGPQINLLDNKDIRASIFILKDGEVNISADGPDENIIVADECFFLGGNVNVNFSYDVEYNDRISIVTGDSCTVDGTNFDISCTAPNDECKYSFYFSVFDCSEKFEMKSGTINVVDTLCKSAKDNTMRYDLILLISDNINVSGGEVCFEYMEPSEANGRELVVDYPLVKCDGEFEVKNATVIIVGPQDVIENYNKIKPGFEDSSTDFFTYNIKYLKNMKLDKDSVKLFIGTSFDISKLGIKLLENEVVYDGKAKEPKIDLKALRIGKNVDVKYSNNIEVGTGEVTITGKGRFTGKVVLKFKIVGSKKNSDKKDGLIYKGNYIYKITKASFAGKKAGAVQVVGLKNKNVKKVKIVNKIKVNGVTYKVTSIKKKAFKGNKKIKSVVIGANVKKIGAYAFANCKKLRKVTIKAKKIKKIGKKAFYRKRGLKITFKVLKKKKAIKKLLITAKTNKYIVK